MSKKIKKEVIPKDNKKALILSDRAKEVIQKLKDPSELKRIIQSYGKFPVTPEEGYKKWAELLTKSLEWGKLTEEENKEFTNIVLGTNITKNHRMLWEVSMENQDRMATIEMAEDLIEEYDCKTTSERSLCEMVVSSYAQVLKINRKMNSTINAGEYLSHERTAYIGVLSKELERANRSYLCALNTLRELKSPNLNIHIKTKTAIIGTNQQFNNNLPPNEIIAG